jgi:hypothetical protein
MNQDTKAQRTSSGEPFFLVMGVVLTSIVVAGFGASAASIPEGIRTLPLLYHIHGLIFLSWFLLFSLQAGFVLVERPDMHQLLGKLSFLIAPAMLVSGFLMMRSAYQLTDFAIGGNSRDVSMIFPVTDLINFSIVLMLGLTLRPKSLAHKRLMLLTCILILDPAVSRLVEGIGASFMMIPVIELGLFGALLGYDIKRLKRPHWASLVGLGLWIFALFAKLSLAHQPFWKSVTVVLFA